MYYVYEVRSKKVRFKSHSKNVALYNLNMLNQRRGELGFALMPQQDYERNYGTEKV